jgi:cytidine deaminase
MDQHSRDDRARVDAASTGDATEQCRDDRPVDGELWQNSRSEPAHEPRTDGGSEPAHEPRTDGGSEPAHEPRTDGGSDTGGDADVDALVARARAAHERSHVPYSDYPVGAAIRTADGTVYTGCNVENANYSNTLHAEELAIGAAVADGHRSFDAIAVSSAARDGVTPCGMCRQTLAEFCPADLPVYCDEGDAVTEHSLADLLPNTISLDTLEAAADDGRDDADEEP